MAKIKIDTKRANPIDQHVQSYLEESINERFVQTNNEFSEYVDKKIKNSWDINPATNIQKLIDGCENLEKYNIYPKLNSKLYSLINDKSNKKTSKSLILGWEKFVNASFNHISAKNHLKEIRETFYNCYFGDVESVDNLSNKDLRIIEECLEFIFYHHEDPLETKIKFLQKSFTTHLNDLKSEKSVPSEQTSKVISYVNLLNCLFSKNSRNSEEFKFEEFDSQTLWPFVFYNLRSGKIKSLSSLLCQTVIDDPSSSFEKEQKINPNEDILFLLIAVFCSDEMLDPREILVSLENVASQYAHGVKTSKDPFKVFLYFIFASCVDFNVELPEQVACYVLKTVEDVAWICLITAYIEKFLTKVFKNFKKGTTFLNSLPKASAGRRLARAEKILKSLAALEKNLNRDAQDNVFTNEFVPAKLRVYAGDVSLLIKALYRKQDLERVSLFLALYLELLNLSCSRKFKAPNIAEKAGNKKPLPSAVKALVKFASLGKVEGRIEKLKGQKVERKELKAIFVALFCYGEAIRNSCSLEFVESLFVGFFVLCLNASRNTFRLFFGQTHNAKKMRNNPVSAYKSRYDWGGVMSLDSNNQERCSTNSNAEKFVSQSAGSSRRKNEAEKKRQTVRAWDARNMRGEMIFELFLSREEIVQLLEKEAERAMALSEFERAESIFEYLGKTEAIVFLNVQKFLFSFFDKKICVKALQHTESVFFEDFNQISDDQKKKLFDLLFQITEFLCYFESICENNLRNLENCVVSKIVKNIKAVTLLYNNIKEWGVIDINSSRNKMFDLSSIQKEIKNKVIPLFVYKAFQFFYFLKDKLRLDKNFKILFLDEIKSMKENLGSVLLTESLHISNEYLIEIEKISQEISFM